MTPRKLIGKIHLWLGLASGLVVFILATTGCLYVFVDEIKPLVYADRLSVESRTADPLPLGSLWDAAQKALGEEYPIQRVRVENASDQSYRFTSFKSNPDAVTYLGSTENFRFEAPWPGLYMLEIGTGEKTPGKHDGMPYGSTWHAFTLSFIKK